MKKKILLISLALAISLLIYSVQYRVVSFPVKESGAESFNAPNNFNKLPIDLEKVIDSISYTDIENTTDFGSVDQVEFRDNRIYILDKKKREVSVFSNRGKFINKIDHHTENFQLDDHQIILYDPTSGSMFFYDKDGLPMGVIRIGYHGIEMLKIENNLYAFYTAGLKTTDRESEKYEFSLTDSSGQVLSYLFPIADGNKNIRFTVAGRLQNFNTVKYITTTFRTEIFTLDRFTASKNSIISFAGHTLREEDLKGIVMAENIYRFPYIFDFTLLGATSDHYFVSYTFKGGVSYAILSRKNPGNSIFGEGIILPKNHESTNFIPVGVYGRYFIGTKLVNHHSDKKTPITKNSRLSLVLYSFK